MRGGFLYGKDMVLDLLLSLLLAAGITYILYKMYTPTSKRRKLAHEYFISYLVLDENTGSVLARRAITFAKLKKGKYQVSGEELIEILLDSPLMKETLEDVETLHGIPPDEVEIFIQNINYLGVIELEEYKVDSHE